MSTPADLLAQQQEVHSPNTSEIYSSDSHAEITESEFTSTVNSSDLEDSKADLKPPARSNPSLLDDSAFPVLAALKSSTAASTNSVWGSSKLTNGAQAAKAPVKIRSLNFQESFTIDLDQQISTTKSESFKIISDVKNKFKVNVESTISLKTNKRTFLITGSQESINNARKEILRKLTKPISIEFTIPSKLRGTVIGPSGRNLTPIIEATGTRIDIGKDDSSSATPEVETELDNEDEFFGTAIPVKVHGDVEGCQRARALILAIVDEHTKSVSVKIEVAQNLLPFIKNEIESAINIPDSIEVFVPTPSDVSSKILINGPREDVLQLREDIKALSLKLAKSLKTETKMIKKSFHKFINVDKIFEESSVVVSIPSASDLSSDVVFFGKANDIKKALELTKQTIDSYNIMTLEISKAHGGNLQHAKYLAIYLTTSGFLDQLSTDSINVSAPSYEALAGDDLNSVQIDITCAKGVERSEAEGVKKLIIDKVNQTAPTSIENVTDIDAFVFPQIDSKIKEVAQENNVTLIPLATLVGSGNKLLLVADPVDSDFLPTAEEIHSRVENVNKALDSLRELSSKITSEVLSVPTDEQKLIYGNNGSTLRTILSNYTKDAVEIKLHQNKNGPSENEILIHGFKDELPSVMKDIKQVIQDVKNHEEAVKYNILVPFPTNLLSRFIGQKGAHMNTLRDTFDVRIDVEDNEGDSSDSTPIKLTGLKVNVDAISEEISTLAKRWADEKTVIMKVEHKYHGALVGKNGIYVKRLEDKYKVNIRFSSDRSSTMDEVKIRGPSRGVAKAEEELKDLLKYEMENGNKSVIQIPYSSLSRVIGKNGETIDKIHSETGANIHSSKDELKLKETGVIDMEIIGTKSAIRSAELKIKEIVLEVENTLTSTLKVDPKYHRILVGPNGSTRRDILKKAGAPETYDRRLLQIPQNGSGSDEIVCTGPNDIVNSIVEQIEAIVLERERYITATCDVPKNKHRNLIGPNGAIRKNLESGFNIQINVPKEDSNSTTVTLKGTPENVELAKQKILELTKEDWLVEIIVPSSVHWAISERRSFFRRLNHDFDVFVDHGNSSRLATKLSNSTIPTPPLEVFGAEGEKSKWTLVEDPKEKSEQEEETIPWRLKGKPENVEKLAKLINQLLEQAKKHDTTGYFFSSQPDIFGKIIGPQGKRVQQLKERTGCFIIIPRADDEVNNVIFVRGDKEGLEKVKNSFLTSSN